MWRRFEVESQSESKEGINIAPRGMFANKTIMALKQADQGKKHWRDVFKKALARRISVQATWAGNPTEIHLDPPNGAEWSESPDRET